MFRHCVIKGQTIVIRGIGKLFYQEGFPIAMSVSRFLEKGFKISVLHIADELLKNGWSPERTINTLKYELSDTIAGDQTVEYDINVISTFCYADYDSQRQMIFTSLFDSREVAMEWAKNLQL